MRSQSEIRCFIPRCTGPFRSDISTLSSSSASLSLLLILCGGRKYISHIPHQSLTPLTVDTLPSSLSPPPRVISLLTLHHLSLVEYRSTPVNQKRVLSAFFRPWSSCCAELFGLISFHFPFCSDVLSHSSSSLSFSLFRTSFAHPVCVGLLLSLLPSLDFDVLRVAGTLEGYGY